MKFLTCIQSLLHPSQVTPCSASYWVFYCLNKAFLDCIAFVQSPERKQSSNLNIHHEKILLWCRKVSITPSPFPFLCILFSESQKVSVSKNPKSQSPESLVLINFENFQCPKVSVSKKHQNWVLKSFSLDNFYSIVSEFTKFRRKKF